MATYPPTYVSRRRWAFLPTYLEGIATYLSIWGGTTTYLLILGECILLSTYLSISWEMATHLRTLEDIWSPPPIYLGGDGHLSVVSRRWAHTYLSFNLGGDGHLYPLM